MKNIIIISLILFSCTKEVVVVKEEPQSKQCNCKEEHYVKDIMVGGNGVLQTYWNWNYATTPQPDLCEKETGQWVEYENGNKRYMVVCE